MPNVTGNVRDIAGSAMDGKQIQVIFELIQPNANGANLYPTEPKVITPGADGSFSVSLAQTSNMVDAGGYRMRMRWIGSDANATLIDFPDWLIVVPSSGGSLGDLITSPGGAPGGTNARMVYVSLSAPPKNRPWSLWLQSDPDDPSNTNRQSSGNLYELRNV